MKVLVFLYLGGALRTFLGLVVTVPSEDWSWLIALETSLTWPYGIWAHWRRKDS